MKKKAHKKGRIAHKKSVSAPIYKYTLWAAFGLIILYTLLHSAYPNVLGVSDGRPVRFGDLMEQTATPPARSTFASILDFLPKLTTQAIAKIFPSFVPKFISEPK